MFNLYCVPQTGAWMMEHPARTSQAAFPRSVRGSGVCSISSSCDSISLLMLTSWSLQGNEEPGAGGSVDVVIFKGIRSGSSVFRFLF